MVTPPREKIPVDWIWPRLLLILIKGGVKGAKILQEGNRMPTYIVLGKWTPQTFKFLKDAPAAVQEAKDLIKKMGAELKGWYVVMGRFDEVCILEAPDDATVGRIVLAVGERYGVKTETMRAFGIDEALKSLAIRS
jgi:uncharacterized protein with GYD domain